MNKLWHIFLLLSGSLTGLSLLCSPGIVLTNVWLEWVNNVTVYGVVEGYRVTHMDYPPLIYLIFFLVGETARLFQFAPLLALKLSLLLFLYLSTLAFWLWTRDLLLSALFQLGLIPGSMLLVYVDIYFIPTLLLSLWALKTRRLSLFTLFYSLTCLIKWQPLIIAPFILLYLLKIPVPDDPKAQSGFERGGVRSKVLYAVYPYLKQILLAGAKNLPLPVGLPLLLSVGLLFAVFGVEPLRAFHLALIDPYLSQYALNFNWILTHLLHLVYPQAYGPLLDGRATPVASDWRVLLIPKILFFAIYGLIWLSYLRQPKTFTIFLFYATVGYFAYFTFNSGVHENHLFLVPLLAGLLAYLERRYLSLFLLLSFISNLNLLKLNLYTSYDLDVRVPFFTRSFGPNLDLLFAVLDVALFIALFELALLRGVTVDRNTG